MHYFVTSFISILHFISDDLIQCDSTTTIAELFCDEFEVVNQRVVGGIEKPSSVSDTIPAASGKAWAKHRGSHAAVLG